MVASDGKEILDIPTGYYFDPTDDIAIHYLRQKIMERELPADIIPTIHDLYTCHPQTIPYDEFIYGPMDTWWFFTSIPNNGDSMGEVGPNHDDFIIEGLGYWKTNNAFPIDHEGKNIGWKKHKIFCYDNPENNVRINNLVKFEHIAYEFIAEEAAFEPQDLNDHVKEQMEHFVLCKVCTTEMIELDAYGDLEFMSNDNFDKIDTS